MSKATPYRFALSAGLAGCYMPNSVSYHECHTRRELMDIVRAELEYQEFPKRSISEFNLREVWRSVQRIKSGSSVHTSAYHNNRCIQLYGLTEEEYLRESAEP